jgi:hypothetical protein
MPHKYTRTPIDVRFWAKVDRRGPDDCWLWTGSRKQLGYGKIAEGGKGGRTLLAPRVAYMLAHGLDALPDDLLVLHNCPGGDNPACVNPAHLWLGTASDNTRDMYAKGRADTGEQHWTRRKPERMTIGERVISSKLTEDDVREIRRRHAGGELQATLSAEYGIVQSGISAIIHRKSWKHVT